MSSSAISRSIDIHYAHRVPLHGGKCAKLHGHRGTIEVTVLGNLQSEGEATDMVIDFGDIENALMEVKGLLCHRTILYKADPWLQSCGAAALPQQGMLPGATGDMYCVLDTSFATLVLLHHAPTAERLAQLCYLLLSHRLNNDAMRVRSVTFWETAKSRAQYPASPVC